MHNIILSSVKFYSYVIILQFLQLDNTAFSNTLSQHWLYGVSLYTSVCTPPILPSEVKEIIIFQD